MLPLDKGAAIERVLKMQRYRVRLIRTGDVAPVYYSRDVEARTYYDAVSFIEQRAVVDHPDDVYVFDNVSRIWRPSTTDEVEGVPA